MSKKCGCPCDNARHAAIDEEKTMHAYTLAHTQQPYKEWRIQRGRAAHTAMLKRIEDRDDALTAEVIADIADDALTAEVLAYIADDACEAKRYDQLRRDEEADARYMQAQFPLGYWVN
jgi:hypothetical protein